MWHGDIISFLNLRKNNGDPNMRTPDLFIAAYISDIFMERVEKDETSESLLVISGDKEI